MPAKGILEIGKCRANFHAIDAAGLINASNSVYHIILLLLKYTHTIDGMYVYTLRTGDADLRF